MLHDIFANWPTPWWSTPGAALYCGDVRACLRTMPASSVHCVVTSPPYWSLRDYHVDGQIGMESSPDCRTNGQAQCGDCFVCSMVSVFRELWRVLRDDGVVWLNLGDIYASTSGGNRSSLSGSTLKGDRDYWRGADVEYRRRPSFLPQGNLVGVPWRVALALQTDGWYLRSDLPWVKRSSLPDSCESRPGKSLEYVFMLSKSADHYFDMDAIRPASGTGEDAVRGFRNGDLWFMSIDTPHGAVGVDDELVGLDVTARGYSGAHYAVFPPALIAPMILSGTSEHGACAQCGCPWRRVVVKTPPTGLTGGVYAPPGQTPHSNARIHGKNLKGRDRSFQWSRNGVESSTLDVGIQRRDTVGWQKLCGCRADEVVPCVVLDPFVGSGTAVATALELGRVGIGVDLSETYLIANAAPRIEAARRGRRDTLPLRDGGPPPLEIV